MEKTSKNSIFLLSSGHFAVDVFSSAMVPLYPYLVEKLGMTLATISVIIALGHLFSSMLQPLFGFFADKMRHRTFMFWGLILSSVFIPLSITSKTTLALAAFFMTGVIGNAIFHPQVTAMISIYTKANSDLTKYMGIFLGAGTIGYAIGPYVSSMLVEKLGINYIFALTIFGLVCAFLMYFMLPKIPKSAVSTAKENFLHLMKEVFSSPVMLNLTWISVVKSMVSMTCATYFPFLLARYGFSLSQTGAIVTVFFLTAGIATMLSTIFEKKIGARMLIKYAFIILLPLMLLAIWTLQFSKILGLLVFIFMGFFIFLSVSITVVLAQKNMPEHRAVVSGVTQGFSWGLAALMLVPFGYIAEATNVELVLIISCIIAFITGLFFVDKRLEC
ncbi:MFS transporter [bacterium]|nr:MFS transporter [bacterium]